MSTSDSCKDGSSTKSNNDNVCEVNDKLQNMRIGAAVSVCANCGKEGDDINNVCAKCQVIKYCNAVCKKVHKKKHRKDCEELIRLAAEKHNEELRIAAELYDKELFKQPPAEEDCPICFLRLPFLNTGRRYMACCGKEICSGCCHAPVYDNQGNKIIERKCPFCRIAYPKSVKEENERLKKRVEVNDLIAIYNLGVAYREGMLGLPQDYTKALEHWHRAGKLGHAESYTNIGYAYICGEQGVEVDENKAKHYYELAAMKGEAQARHNLGLAEERTGNWGRALKHQMIAVRSGQNSSLEEIKKLYTNGYVSKDDYTKALQSYQAYLSEIKSAQRDKAAAAHEMHRYY